MADDAPVPLDVDAGASRSKPGSDQPKVSLTEVSPIFTVWQMHDQIDCWRGGRGDFLLDPSMKTILLALCESDVFLHARFMRCDHLFPGLQNSVSDED